MSSHDLTVTKAFGKYKAGQIITDPVEIDTILASNKRHNVVRVFAKTKVGAHAPEVETPAVDTPADPAA